MSNANNFSFSSATFDYTLKKSETEGSTLHVTEKLVAEFPDFDQNHGIERYIPYTNKGGNNITIQNQSALNFNVTRNGITEPFSISKESEGYYYTRIGNANSYVTGQQTYVLDYDFSRVITEYNNTDTQELYWDTNGTGWHQRFNTLTANVHLPSDVKPLDASCYVGKQGANGSERCEITKTDDGYTFTTSNLAPRENLTFDLEFPANTFEIPPLPNSYSAIILSAILISAVSVIFFIFYKYLWSKIRNDYRWYKDAPVPPQYTPIKGYSVAEHAMIYLGKTREPKVATLLELAVSKKITLTKGEKKKLSNKYSWTVTVNSLEGLSPDQLALLKLFNDGRQPSVGVAYEVKKQDYSSALETAYKQYDSDRELSLEQKGDRLDPKSTKSGSSKVIGAISIFIMLIIGLPIIMAIFFESTFESILDTFNPDYYNIVASWLTAPVIIITIVSIIIILGLTSKLGQYEKYTREGLEHSNYIRGLELYIKMAEADRIKFLQSVDGADTSNAGIVKLYEKLLPYAALFGLEQSWLKELSHYYKMEDIVEPDWYDVGLAYALSSRTFSSNFSRPVDPSSYSSSGSSGGGGGGFSGGGGGGGGGGGW